MKLPTILRMAFVIMLALSLFGCQRSDDGDGAGADGKVIIQNAGSDTMVNLAQAWAEEYATVEPNVSIEVSGGGSGTGIAALINGTVDIANCSRKMEPNEIARAEQNTGETPIEYVVGYDALAVYVHESNPLETITIPQLADIYGEGGEVTKWSGLGITHSKCSSDEIIRVSRQSNSGTYHYFREAILGEAHDFKLGSRDLHGSKDVVELVEKTPCAIGYSGMGYATEHVKMLSVARTEEAEANAPNLENALSGAYPIARPLYMYSLGEPTGETKKYLDWVRSAAGQQIVRDTGYVPLPTDERKSVDQPSGE